MESKSFPISFNERNALQNGKTGEWNLCFQWCMYENDNGNLGIGYRFIWLKPDGKLQAARGQAIIPSLAEMNEMITKAAVKG